METTMTASELWDDENARNELCSQVAITYHGEGGERAESAAYQWAQSIVRDADGSQTISVREVVRHMLNEEAP